MHIYEWGKIATKPQQHQVVDFLQYGFPVEFEGALPSPSQVASSQVDTQDHFGHFQDLLTTLGLDEAKHKASPPSQRMIWLGLQFDSIEMTILMRLTQWWLIGPTGHTLTSTH